MNKNVFKTGKIQLLLFSGLIMFFSSKDVDAQNEYKVLESWLQYTDTPISLYHHLTNEAFALLDAREEKISKLITPDEWKQREQEMKQNMWDVLGSFPEKTPLNARITGKIQKEGYSIENVIYESLPGFYVTGSLFLPHDLQKQAPAILFCSGHSTEAYRKQSYQLPLLNLVKKGFIVLAVFDPVISRVALIKPYSSYRSFVINRFYEPRFVYSLVPGALKAYDLPDLASSLAPAKLLIAGVTNANGQPNIEETEKDLEVIKNAYIRNNAGNRLEFQKPELIKNPENLFSE